MQVSPAQQSSGVWQSAETPVQVGSAADADWQTLFVQTLEQQSLPTVHVALSFAHAVPGPASARLAVPALCSVERQALSRQT